MAIAPAQAGTVYRCDGAGGERSYVSKRVPGAKCTVVSQYRPSRAAPYVPARAPAGAGSATPANPVA
ncbi:MAG: lytic transglycosylase domain-containing protein, partial [Lysobacter sp.]|nr:lytic transglycosylase domain-containing protein [Lysobacter sp.]